MALIERVPLAARKAQSKTGRWAQSKPGAPRWSPRGPRSQHGFALAFVVTKTLQRLSTVLLTILMVPRPPAVCT